MAKKVEHKLSKTLLEELEKIVGHQCCIQRIAYDGSLFFGFGEAIQSRTNPEVKHGKWEIGTYYCSWRILQGKDIVCGSQDTVDSISELQQSIDRLEWGHFLSLKHLSTFDLRIEFSNEIAVDILGTVSDEDELMHIFFPQRQVAVFSIRDGWRVGPSDEPWT